MRSGAEPTILGGGLLARETSWDGSSDIAGVDGLLCWAEDNDGLLDPLFAEESGGNALDFSGVADAGVGSATFVVVPVVKRKVLGLAMDALDGSEGVVAAGVAGRELRVPGVPTIFESSIGVADFSDGKTAETAVGTGGIAIFPGLCSPALVLVFVSALVEGDLSVFAEFSSAFSDMPRDLSISFFDREARSFGEPKLNSLASVLVFRI